MKTQLATTPRRSDHPPQPTPVLEQRPVRRVGLVDRAALHLGVALVTWGRRPIRPSRRRRAPSDRERHEAEVQREHLRSQHELWGAGLTRLR
ncbi:hypothetical protein [Mycetocola manganoxydans]|nr:hypothetical protein [Mycetocola manganoxydans]